MSSAASTASSRTAALSVAPAEGEAIWFNGALITVKAPAQWSEDAFSLVEVAMQKGRATALHTDPSHETFYVLEGELLFHLDGEEHRFGIGETVSIRRGVPHAHVVVSELARFLVFNTPGADRFFRDGGYLATDRDFRSAPPPDLERTVAAAERHGLELLGPPPFPEELVRVRSG